MSRKKFGVALYDCAGADASELSFKKGQRLVEIRDTNDPGWIEARLHDSSQPGLVPANYVRIEEEQEVLKGPNVLPRPSTPIFKNAQGISNSPRMFHNQLSNNDDYRKNPYNDDRSNTSPGGPLPPPIPRRPSDRFNPSPPLPPRRAISSPSSVISRFSEKSTTGPTGRDSPPGIPAKASTLVSLDSKIPPPPTSNVRSPYQNQESAIPRKSKNPFEEDDSWIIPEKSRLSYGQLFAIHDQDHDGYLLGNEVKSIFTKSKLDKTLLGSIWNLCDVDDDGKLDKEEFILGMYLIDECVMGKQLPNPLPTNLIPPSKRIS